MSGFRLPNHGHALDRNRPLAFRFGGQNYSGFAGDTLASALMANGISITGRSFKYHRPRGTVATGAAETNSLMQLNGGGRSTPNVPATLIPLTDGLEASPVNCWPSAEFDVASINGVFSAFLSVGFYYKTFMWPSWHLFEGFIRRAAGLGRAPALPDSQYYAIKHCSVDKLIIGASIAATMQENLGDNALVIDSGEIVPTPGANCLSRTTAIAALDHGLILAIQDCDYSSQSNELRQRLWLIRAEQIVLAADMQEQPLVFARNDLPGVMLSSAIEEYVTRYGVSPGRKCLIATTEKQGAKLQKLLRSAGIEVSGRVITDRGEAVQSACGRRRVSAADVVRANGSVERIECDCIAMSGGFAPSIQLYLQAGGKLQRDCQTGALVPSEDASNIKLSGTIDTAPSAIIPESIWTSRKLAESSFVDFQTDVTVADVVQAVDENYSTPDHLKRYTVLGMGTDQGRLSGMNGANLLASISGQSLENVLPTKTRPPIVPTAFAAIGAGKPPGELMRPRRILPAAAFHSARGAVFDDYGWERPSHYPKNNETLEDAAQREAKAVRTTAGIFDGSPLGKIEVRGPEAGRFLDHIYVGKMSTLKQGRIRYGLMLNENGTIFDDGVAMRLADDHYLLNCTSGNAERVFEWIDEHHQCEWQYDLVVQNVTTDWATFAIAGPLARQILTDCGGDIELSGDAFPHLSIRTGMIANMHARVARVSFSGEPSYEVSVHASNGERLANILWEHGAPLGLTPYGIEALEILRVEKGYIHIGSDTDSESQPGDIGFGGAWPKKQSDFIGRRSLLRPNSQSPQRKQLVGLKLDNADTVLPMGAHVLGSQRQSIGWVGSSYFSPNLNHGVALAMMDQGRDRMGEKVTVYSEKKTWLATITNPSFFDPQNERLK